MTRISPFARTRHSCCRPCLPPGTVKTSPAVLVRRSNTAPRTAADKSQVHIEQPILFAPDLDHALCPAPQTKTPSPNPPTAPRQPGASRLFDGRPRIARLRTTPSNPGIRLPILTRSTA